MRIARLENADGPRYAIRASGGWFQAWVAERRNEYAAAEEAYRRTVELAGQIGFTDHASFALARLGWNAFSSGDLRHAEELSRRALAAAEAASMSWIAAHTRGQRGRVLEATGDADTAETLYRSVVEWSETPRPSRFRETLFVALAGSPVAAALRVPGAAYGGPRGRRRGRQLAGPRSGDGATRPRAARRARLTRPCRPNSTCT